MDTELLKTFLEVNRTRHFGKAAENLCLTQSAVSARIRLLEDLLGIPLFTRARNNVQLTPQGERLVRHSETILNAWTRAKHEVAVSKESTMALSVGGIASLWDILLQDWLLALSATFPALSLTAEVLSNEHLVRRVRDRTLDLAFSFESPQLTEVKVEEIATVSLIMVTSHPGFDCRQALSNGDYVLVDWGTGFAVAHAQAFPEIGPPRMRFGLGRLAHAFVLARGGTLYLPEQIVGDELQVGRFHRVSDAPVMKRAAYALFGVDANRDGLIGKVLDVGLATAPGPSRRDNDQNPGFRYASTEHPETLGFLPHSRIPRKRLRVDAPLLRRLLTSYRKHSGQDLLLDALESDFQSLSGGARPLTNQS